MPRVFLSHSTRDRAFVESVLLPALQKHGIETWFAPHDINTAEEWARMILQGLQLCDWFLVVLSEEATTSTWVRAEVHWALDNREGRLIPVFLRNCNPDDIHLRLRTIQGIDFRTDQSSALEALLRLWGKHTSSLTTTKSSTEFHQRYTQPVSPSSVLAAPPTMPARLRSIRAHRLFLLVAVPTFICIGLSIGIWIVHQFAGTFQATSDGGFKIDIVSKSRREIDFVVSSGESDHFIVSRLFVSYRSEFERRPQEPKTEDTKDVASYVIPLSRAYSEYDLFPQTKDNTAKSFEYLGAKSENFRVRCEGFEVARLQVCATVWDGKRRETFLIKSEIIDMVRSSASEPLWLKSLPVKEGRLAEEFEPLLYKTLTHQDFAGFIDSFDPSFRRQLRDQLESTLTRGGIEKQAWFGRMNKVKEYLDRSEQRHGAQKKK